MIRHPLLLSIAAVDAVCLAALVVAVAAVFPALMRWQPGAADRAQIAAERRAEAGVLAARIAAGALALSTLMLVAGISLVLPDAVAGAMCGTGVLQAVGPLGTRAVILRFFGLLALSVWKVLESLNRSRPEAVLTATAARVLAAAAPVVVLALFDSARAMWGIDFGQPVDCCAAVYDPVYGPGAGNELVSDRFWVFCFSAFTGLLAVAAVIVRRGGRGVRRRWGAALAALTLVWVASAAASLVKVFSAYIFGVLAHDCPWCLFLPEHGMVGFIQFGALALAAGEGAAAPAASMAAAAHPPLLAPAAVRMKAAAGRILWAMAVFCLSAVGPALLWRLRHGVWISG